MTSPWHSAAESNWLCHKEGSNAVLTALNDSSRRLFPLKHAFKRATLWALFLVLSLKSCYITPILRYVHWLRISEHIEYKLLSLTYKVLTNTQPPYLHNLIYVSVQRHRRTSSSSIVCSATDYIILSKKITDRCFRYASPCLWSQLPLFLNQHYSGTSSSISYSAIPSPITFSSFDSPLWSSIIPPLFHSGLKPTCFTNLTSVVSLLPPNCLHWLFSGQFLLSYSVFVFSFFLIFSFLCRAV